LLLVADHRDRAGGMEDQLLADRADQQTDEAAMASITDDYQLRLTGPGRQYPGPAKLLLNRQAETAVGKAGP
jgi:hypothetical protein